MKKVKAGGCKGLEVWQDVPGLAWYMIQAAGKRKVQAEG